MADRGSSLSSFGTKTLFVVLSSLLLLDFAFSLNHVHVHEFDKRDVTFKDFEEESESSNRQKRETSNDEKCQNQQKDHLSQYGGTGNKNIGYMHKYMNDNNSALAVTWAGTDDVIIVVTTTETISFLTMAPEGRSTVYRSINNGRNFTDISDKVDKAFIRKSAGLQRNTHTPSKVYMVSPTKTHHNLYITEDGGLSFTKSELPFALSGTFKYHPTNDRWMLAVSSGMTKNLYVSTDNGRNWDKIKEAIIDVKWATPESQSNWESCIYVTTVEKPKNNVIDLIKVSQAKKLEKSCDKGQTWTTLLEDTYSFGIEGKFLYASVAGEDKSKKDQRVMNVSTDGGDSWAEALLPTIVHGQFYSILDMSEGLVFIHVDRPGDSGYGDLYMSSGKGIIFSESLKFHLYPNYAEVTDFYPVKSLRGVYITSQMLEDKSIRSMISYNRGASWSVIKRPDGVPCKDESKECNLQLHNSYSISRSLAAEPPKSEASAVGIILAHGHVAEALQTTKPDVFVSDDGGYSWSLALKGPHMYQIADHGGLLVAIPKTPNRRVSELKFSVDEGRCWHKYKFTEEPIIVTGLLTEPGSKSASVGIWGFGSVDKKWLVYVVDFSDVVKDKCNSDHYQKWTAHSEHRANEKGDMGGCLLGVRETFTRLKKDSWCLNGYDYQQIKKSSTCTCTREDYECDYSYMRPAGKDECVKQAGFKNGEEIKICYRGHEEKIVTVGYRKIPGDNCTGNVNLGDQIVNLDVECDSNKEIMPELIHKTKEEEKKSEASSHRYILFVILGLAAGCLAIFVLAVFVYRFYFANRHIMNYRYSLLHHNDDRDFDAEFDAALTSTSHKFEDSEDEQLSRQNNKQNGKVSNYHDDSDVEMLD